MRVSDLPDSPNLLLGPLPPLCTPLLFTLKCTLYPILSAFLYAIRLVFDDRCLWYEVRCLWYPVADTLLFYYFVVFLL